MQPQFTPLIHPIPPTTRLPKALWIIFHILLSFHRPIRAFIPTVPRVGLVVDLNFAFMRYYLCRFESGQ